MSATSKLVVSLVNPRFQNFNWPLLLAVLVGALTLALALAVFFIEYTTTRCTSLTFNTPQNVTQHSESQYVGDFNRQVTYVWTLRFGGSYEVCIWEGDEQGREPTCDRAGEIGRRMPCVAVGVPRGVMVHGMYMAWWPSRGSADLSWIQRNGHYRGEHG